MSTPSTKDRILSLVEPAVILSMAVKGTFFFFPIKRTKYNANTEKPTSASSSNPSPTAKD